MTCLPHHSPDAPSALDALLSLTRFINASLGWHRHLRNGKVARLPEPIRNRINLMLQDGLPYRDIIARLQQAGGLPHPVSEMNLSNWRRGGFRDWTLNKSRTAAAIPAQPEVPEAVSRQLGILKAFVHRSPQPPAPASAPACTCNFDQPRLASTTKANIFPHPVNR